MSLPPFPDSSHLFLVSSLLNPTAVPPISLPVIWLRALQKEIDDVIQRNISQSIINSYNNNSPIRPFSPLSSSFASLRHRVEMKFSRGILSVGEDVEMPENQNFQHFITADSEIKGEDNSISGLMSFRFSSSLGLSEEVTQRVSLVCSLPPIENSPSSPSNFVAAEFEDFHLSDSKPTKIFRLPQLRSFLNSLSLSPIDFSDFLKISAVSALWDDGKSKIFADKMGDAKMKFPLKKIQIFLETLMAMIEGRTPTENKKNKKSKRKGREGRVGEFIDDEAEDDAEDDGEDGEDGEEDDDDDDEDSSSSADSAASVNSHGIYNEMDDFVVPDDFEESEESEGSQQSVPSGGSEISDESNESEDSVKRAQREKQRKMTERKKNSEIKISPKKPPKTSPPPPPSQIKKNKNSLSHSLSPSLSPSSSPLPSVSPIPPIGDLFIPKSAMSAPQEISPIHSAIKKKFKGDDDDESLVLPPPKISSSQYHSPPLPKLSSPQVSPFLGSTKGKRKKRRLGEDDDDDEGDENENSKNQKGGIGNRENENLPDEVGDAVSSEEETRHSHSHSHHPPHSSHDGHSDGEGQRDSKQSKHKKKKHKKEKHKKQRREQEEEEEEEEEE